MAYPEVVTREEWLAARKRLLTTEKEHTRSRDALNAERRRLPMVRIDKEYVFEGPEGKVTLAGLFAGSRQLIVQHVMFGPDWDAACPGCTASIDELADGVLTHLRLRSAATCSTGDKGDYAAGVIDVLTLDGDRIAAVTAFVTFDLVDLPGDRQVTAAEVFARFGLPARLP